jgi:hypothetical protein
MNTDLLSTVVFLACLIRFDLIIVVIHRFISLLTLDRG